MITANSVLKEYFRYDVFRPLQEDIINSVLEGRDTLALMPTGGGKSVCFQVPALMRDGICLVVSPLVALMKDQVTQLKKHNIKAAALFSGMSYHEMDIALDNCVYGYYKFLYVSPERLKTEIFIERFKKMKVNLIAVDEAHCISQWGYDFRPSYREIVEVRKWHPEVPVLALTASANNLVQKDIIEQLKFKKSKTFKKSFIRDNLSFIVRREDAKYPKLLEITQKLKGSGIVYVRNRNKTKEVAAYLIKNGISADFYHAGLKLADRNRKQEDWMKNTIKVMVCTNAFGMGIDKSDVRFVVHLDVPESIEAYYQEAGRAGRDGKLSYAALLYVQSDLDNLRVQAEQKFPAIPMVKKVYNALCNHLGVALESGKMMTYEFDIVYFCNQFGLEALEVLNSLKILEQHGYLQLSDGFLISSRAVFSMNKSDLYRYEVAHSDLVPILKMLLRSYGGIMEHYTKISESLLASRLNITEAAVKKQLQFLQRHKVLTYVPASDKPSITFLMERMHENNLYIDVKFMNLRKKTTKEQVASMIHFVEQDKECRQKVICNYFGEEDAEDCGKCDMCLEKKRKLQQQADFKEAKMYIAERTKDNWVHADDLLPKNAHFARQLYKDVIRFMLDEKILISNEKNELKCSKTNK